MNNFTKFLTQLKINKLHKRKYFYANLSKPTLPLIVLLLKLNIIKGAKKLIPGTSWFSYKYIILLNHSCKLELVPMSKKKNRFVSLKTIKNLVFLNKWLAVLSTNKGLLTTKQCIKQNVGGILLYNVMVNI